MNKAKVIIQHEIAQRELANKHKKHLRFDIVKDELISLKKVISIIDALNEPTTEVDTSKANLTILVVSVAKRKVCLDPRPYFNCSEKDVNGKCMFDAFCPYKQT